LPLSRGKWADDVHSPFSKGPLGGDVVQFFLLDMGYVLVLLAWYAAFDKAVDVCHHGGPVVSCP